MRNAYRILVGKPEEKILFGKPGCRSEENVKMYFWEIWLEGVNWIHLDQDRDRWRALVNTVVSLRVP
jgi:hypothetical protein